MAELADAPVIWSPFKRAKKSFGIIKKLTETEGKMMKKVMLVTMITVLFLTGLAIVSFAHDYLHQGSRNLAESWSSPYTINSDTSTASLKSQYSVWDTGILWWKTTHFKGEATGTPNYSTGYVAVTFWIGNDWDYNSHSELNDQGKYYVSYESSGSNSRPTQIQFYFRDGQYGVTSDYDTYTYLVSQSTPLP